MTILITGANRGIGRGLYDAYAARGAQVIGTTRAQGDDPAWVTLDVTRPEQIRALSARLDGRPLDLLVCNAGAFLDRGQNLSEGYAPDIWAQMFATNVTGVFLTIQALLPDLQAARTPKVAILSSQMGSTTRAPGGSYVYRASKAAVLNLGRNLAADLKGLGIAVGIYHPGWVRTDMGGPQADIGLDESVRGLIARFEALSLDSTGCFETWDGRAHPY